MKQTDFIKKIKFENRKYKTAKLKSFFFMKLSFGKKREQRKFSYSIFKEDHFWDRDNNGLLEEFYFKPTDIILYDLIPKEKLSQTKRGLVKLFKKCYSHKFLNAGTSDTDIENLISGLDQTLHKGNSWYDTSLFDFAYDDKLNSYIDYFEIKFHNFSSSYASIEMRIALDESFINEISKFISDSYKKPGMCVHRYWGRNGRKSGAKISYGVSSGVPSECAKSQLLYEQLQYVKILFLKEIKCYFPLMQCSKNRNIYGINVFETNICPYDKLPYSVYSALGIDDMQGFNLSIAERLYISTVTIRTRDSYKSDMMFLYNPELITGYEMYVTAHNKVIRQLTRGYMKELYRGILLKDIGIRYQDLISEYRNMINACKAGRINHKKLLKMKYSLSRDFYDFKKIDEELGVDKELEKIDIILSKNKYSRSSVNHGVYPYKFFAVNINWIWKQVRENYMEVENDLDRKIEISSALTGYSAEKSNRRMVFIQVLLATVTLILTIFSDKATELAEQIKTIWDWLENIFIR